MARLENLSIFNDFDTTGITNITGITEEINSASTHYELPTAKSIYDFGVESEWNLFGEYTNLNDIDISTMDELVEVRMDFDLYNTTGETSLKMKFNNETGYTLYVVEGGPGLYGSGENVSLIIFEGSSGSTYITTGSLRFHRKSIGGFVAFRIVDFISNFILVTSTARGYIPYMGGDIETLSFLSVNYDIINIKIYYRNLI
jgi:hypothetical protein